MLYAAYGSNLHPVRLRLRLPQSRFLGTAEVPGFELCFHKQSIDRSGKCNIVPGDGKIHVSVYELTAYERAKLDRIEGAGIGYHVESIAVPGFGDGFTYVAPPSHIDGGLRPYTWYKALVLVGCEAHAFPAGYVSGVRGIATVDDNNKQRHAENMRIVDQARMSVPDSMIHK